jgi:ubiquinone/menaquinone biosynthesis C-methylase UbiE
MTEKQLQINEDTRKIYHDQHKRVAGDLIAMRRFMSMIDTDYFNVGADFFKGKKVLDAGCGDTAKLSIKFAELGASVVGCDLGEDFVPTAEASVARWGGSDAISFESASIIDLPFEDESFDFVCCHGVLLHLADFEQVDMALSELSRVLKKGGALYTAYGVVGGLIEKAIIPAVRQYYSNNKDFRVFIDNIDKSDFTSTYEFCERLFQQMGIDLELNKDKVAELFDTDFCVTVQNIIQAPVRLEISEDFVRNLYQKNGFGDVERLRRFVKRKNVRKYFAPLHFEHKNNISKLFYGSGNLEFISYKH